MSENAGLTAGELGSAGDIIRRILSEVERVIVGQQLLVERLAIGLLTNSHLLIEGVPGLAKTTTVKALADTISAGFQRIQFTPDLLPADVVGTQVYNPRDGLFTTRKGPIFANIILADEINRAPAKVHSALLEAMEERQVTIGGETHRLDELFIVMATQNPIEQDGTYPLPEAQLDRFLFKLTLAYPEYEEERLIMRQRAGTGHAPRASAVASPMDVIAARRAVERVHMDEKIEKYILDLVFATRHPQRANLDDLAPLIRYGASPRASIGLSLASRAHALIRGRTYVTPQDVKSVGADVLRHRLLTSYEADADGVTSDQIIQRILEAVEVP